MPEHTATSLEGVARSVWIVEAAEGKDVRDHLNAGLAVNDLVWWCMMAREWTPPGPVPDEAKRAAHAAGQSGEPWEDLVQLGTLAPLPEFPVGTLPEWVAAMASARRDRVAGAR